MVARIGYSAYNDFWKISRRMARLQGRFDAAKKTRSYERHESTSHPFYSHNVARWRTYSLAEETDEMNIRTPIRILTVLPVVVVARQFWCGTLFGGGLALCIVWWMR